MTRVHEDRVQALLEHSDAGDIELTERELEFLDSLVNTRGDSTDPKKDLSYRQARWLDDLYYKHIDGRGWR